MRPTVPLTLLFAALTQGCCVFKECTSCGTNATWTAQRNQDELFLLLAEAGVFDTGDTDADTGTEVVLPCESICSDKFTSAVDACTLVPASGRTFDVECTGSRECAGGRMHAIVDTARAELRSKGVRGHLAAMAHDEWASVVAFQTLENELRAYGAPQHLRSRVLEAADDEIRHGRAIAALAEAHGGIAIHPVIGSVQTRSLEAIARENVVEAVVLETWAALRATVQAERAADPVFRAAMQTIAVDETRHAELARDLDTWFRSQLDADANRRLDAARDKAFADLLLTSQQPMPPEVQEQLGWPDPASSTLLLQGLAAALWS